MPTSEDLTAVCERVLALKAQAEDVAEVNGVRFVTRDGTSLLRPDDDNSGWCQRTVRLAYLAATGKAMPEADCCARHTWDRLLPTHRDAVTPGPWDEAKLKAGDLLYFGGGGKCGECGRSTGHVGIWLGDGRMFQHTSRKVGGKGLAITSAGPTADQRKRFLGAVRLLETEQRPAPTIVRPDGRKITAGVTIAPGGAMQLLVGKEQVAVRDIAKALGYTLAWEPKTRTARMR